MTLDQSTQEKINESHEWEITYSGPRKFVFPPVITRMGSWDASHTGIDFHIDGKLYKSHTLFTVGMFNFPRISKFTHAECAIPHPECSFSHIDQNIYIRGMCNFPHRSK